MTRRKGNRVKWYGPRVTMHAYPSDVFRAFMAGLMIGGVTVAFLIIGFVR